MNKPRYEFNEENHVHTLDGKPLTGCTTVLGVIAKPALISWAANMVARYIEEHCVSAEKGIDYVVSKEQLEEARKAHTKRKEKAGDWGKELHAKIEVLIKQAMDKGDGYLTEATVDDERIAPFVEWAQANNVKFLASEQNIYSEKMWTGGIVDIICEIDGKRFLGDLKTSGSGLHPENWWQMGGYDMMLEEMGEKPADGYVLLNIKQNGEFVEKRSIDMEDHKTAFLDCLEIYRLLEKAKILL